jgi:glycosyltransferase involved in cell wall biosynthesis
MRLLMLNNEFPPLGGGTGTVNLAVLQQLRCMNGAASQHNLEIDLITSAEEKKSSLEMLSENIRIHRLPVNRWNIHHASNQELLIYTMRALGVAIKLHLSKPFDLCMAWSAVPAGGTALALRWLTGLRYIVRVCGPDIPGFELRYGALYTILTPVIRSIWHGADMVVAKCDGEAHMIHAVDPEVAVTMIPNGVDLAAFRPAQIPASQDTLRLLCVARLIERKGQHHLIEAVRRLTEIGLDVSLDLIGTGDAQENLEHLAQYLGVASRVHFLGYIPRERIAAYYSDAHVFALASYNEGMSVASLEALASGLPLVITRTGGSAELVSEGINGYTFNWGDVDALVAHLKRLYEDRRLLQRMGIASRRRAGLFSWEKVARGYVEIFEQLTMSSFPAKVERLS